LPLRFSFTPPIASRDAVFASFFFQPAAYAAEAAFAICAMIFFQLLACQRFLRRFLFARFHLISAPAVLLFASH